jgi:hypothetical protein
MTRVLALLVLGVLAGLLWLPASARAQTSVAGALDLLRAHVVAYNAGDVDAQTALFTEDALIQLLTGPDSSSGFRYTGKAQIRAMWQSNADGRGQVRIVGSPQVAGNRITWTARTSSPVTQAQNNALQFDAEAVTISGRIQSLTTRNYVTIPLQQFEQTSLVLPATGRGAPWLPVAIGAVALITLGSLAAHTRRGARPGSAFERAGRQH